MEMELDVGVCRVNLSEKVNAKGFKSLTYPSPNPEILIIGNWQVSTNP
jgi:hypothetical protein